MALPILNLKSMNLPAYLIRTSGVPLSYHHLQNVEKTKGLHVPLEYHYSTSILKLTPHFPLDKIKTTYITFILLLKTETQNSNV